MYIFQTKIVWLGLLIALLLAACNDPSKESGNGSFDETPVLGSSAAHQKPLLEVFKSPTCGCCSKWIRHLEDRGFDTHTKHPAELDTLKKGFGIASEYHSCHTAVSRQGFVFEGHVPARYVRQFLAQPPQHSIGLAVPAMPAGSPGMEMGDRFMPYRVLLLKTDGSSEIYARVETARQQFDEESEQ
jgi:hypothetical protein